MFRAASGSMLLTRDGRRYKIKIYDVNKQQWVAGFNGQWAVWEKPSKGIYWTHFELYTSNGKLVETKTYAFGV